MKRFPAIGTSLGPSTHHAEKSAVWAGRFDTHEPEAGSTDLIRHVYLLRNAHQALGTGSGAQVIALLRHFLLKEQELGFLVRCMR